MEQNYKCIGGLEVARCVGVENNGDKTVYLLINSSCNKKTLESSELKDAISCGSLFVSNLVVASDGSLEFVDDLYYEPVSNLTIILLSKALVDVIAVSEGDACTDLSETILFDMCDDYGIDLDEDFDTKPAVVKKILNDDLFKPFVRNGISYTKYVGERWRLSKIIMSGIFNDRINPSCYSGSKYIEDYLSNMYEESYKFIHVLNKREAQRLIRDINIIITYAVDLKLPEGILTQHFVYRSYLSSILNELPDAPPKKVWDIN